MRDVIETILLVVIIFVVFATVMLSLFFLGNCYQENTLSKLGYQTKKVNGQCFAKLGETWIDCDQVSKNQIKLIEK